MTDTRMAIDKPTLWFSIVFLNRPPLGWEVDWDHIDHTTPRPCRMTTYDLDDWNGCEYMAGILVKHVASGRVWRLTGVTRASPEMFEGKWPD